ncbi:glycoside hydrolase superfamily [Diplogelasinospora grovesii]|uniref:non-reducing end alpha-L-arabinofuranosidase n=1 Tax=Diplogelasinospora grovesii TaxID=303347 RepID=A0AAN6S2R2_9PEZI|nr:glycoside hydrolase superfamily [Diplogelasinospora grovesii]
MVRVSAALICSLFGAANAVTLTVSTTGGNASSPLLYGIMFEDINNSGDGGIHGQLLRNNGFQGNSPDLTAYSSVGSGVTLSVDTANPLSTAITRSLKVTVASGTTGQVGFANAGYLGVPVNADTYANYFWVKGTYSGAVTLSLYGPSGTVYATKTITINSNSSAWSYYETTYTSTQSYESNNAWKLTFDASKVAGSALYFDLVQLFPVTYHQRYAPLNTHTIDVAANWGRYNGLRNDVATYLEQIKPSFLRFPGGNNLEGATPATRWKWNETIGPVHMRPGRQGDWGYPNTDALGLMEYMQWCIDMSMEPLLAVWSGLSLGGGIISGTALTPYVNDILNELEFLLGATTTTYGALRATYGRTDPYSLTYIEVGNEDNLSSGCATYASRFTAIYNAVHAKYPDLVIVASTSQASCLPSPLPTGVYTDTHHYSSPDQFVGMFNEWDNYPRSNGNGVLVGEYASTTGNDGSATYWSNMQGSCGEAVYMIGMERNSDVVKMASFAPLFEHYDMAEWSPDLFGVNSTVGSITGSTSFWVQYMFSTHRGTTILPVTSDTNFGPVYWVASSQSGGTYYAKLANYGSAAASVTVKFSGTGFSTAAQLTLLSGPQLTANYPGIVSITPQTSTVTGSSSAGYTFSIPAWGVAVLAVTA